MKIFETYIGLAEEAQGTVLMIGNFDGVHKGHRHLLKCAQKLGQEHALPTVALTFEPHPHAVLKPDETLLRLTPATEKRRLLMETGIDWVHVVPFTPAFALKTAEEFIHDVLVDVLKAQHVVVGEGFLFGAQAQGTVEVLQACTAFQTHEIDMLLDEDGQRYSSGRLRQALLDKLS